MKIKTVILATVFALSSTLAMAQGAGGGAGGAGNDRYVQGQHERDRRSP